MRNISRCSPFTSTYIILTLLLLFVISCNSNTTSSKQATPTSQSIPSIHATPTPHNTPTPTPTRTPDNTPLQLSSDPYSNGMGQYQTEVEPDTYSYGSTIVATFQAGRYRDIASDNIGWTTSANQGSTWVNG